GEGIGQQCNWISAAGFVHLCSKPDGPLVSLGLASLGTCLHGFVLEKRALRVPNVFSAAGAFGLVNDGGAPDHPPSKGNGTPPAHRPLMESQRLEDLRRPNREHTPDAQE